MIRRSLIVNEPFAFEAGGTLAGMEIAYYTSDREYRPGDKVVWICHALTGNANPEDWWPQMVGEGCLIDPARYYVVCVSMIGSPYGECGPASINPATGKPYLLDFPKTTIRDMVKATILVRRHLGISKVDLLIGPSIGGFQAVEWSVMEPDIFTESVFLATDTRVPPILTAYEETQRMALLADPTFLAAEGLDGGRKGLECARAMALISYRTSEGYNLTQPETDDDVLFADRAASYQRYQGQKLIKRDFDAYSYWYLSYSLDSMNVGRGRGGVAAALAGIKARCMVINIPTDAIFTPSRGRANAAAIPGAEYREIISDFGHDGFLIENDQLTAIFRELSFFADAK